MSGHLRSETAHLSNGIIQQARKRWPASGEEAGRREKEGEERVGQVQRLPTNFQLRTKSGSFPVLCP